MDNHFPGACHGLMNLRVSIHFKRKPDGSHLATAVMVSGKTVRFFRTVLAAGVDPYAAYGDVAASAVNYLADNAEPERTPDAPKDRTKGRVTHLQGVLR